MDALITDFLVKVRVGSPKPSRSHCCAENGQCQFRVPIFRALSFVLIESGWFRHLAICDDHSQLLKNLHCTCAVKRRWSTAGESPARELGSLHPEAIRAAVEETKPSEPLV